MPNRLTDEQIEIATEWWAKAVESPKFDALGPTRGKDHRETSSMGMAEAMASTLAAAHPVKDSAAFQAALAEKLKEAPPFCLGVDYGPDMTLGEAGQKGGVDRNRFPWKTVMWFENGGVQVRHGYGAKIEELLKAAG